VQGFGYHTVGEEQLGQYGLQVVAAGIFGGQVDHGCGLPVRSLADFTSMTSSVLTNPLPNVLPV
jgi:hypothetical protein